LGKGLGALLAESAQQPVRTLSEPDRFKDLRPGQEPKSPTKPVTPPAVVSQTVDNKLFINRGVLLAADVLLLAIGAWLITASPMARTPAALAVGVVLLLIGCALGVLAITQPGPSK
jgi:hypothetical protein